ncbi:MAG: GTP 3',8-cyclase MoaA [Candidatus Bathyarchaeota archaeon]|nr:GTP 3',8-cyclase MoaA [Candidatus Bathyarchaeota archaeon]
MIKDRFGRPITSLRISLTQKCNLRCLYCHKEGEVKENSDEMTSGEVKKIVEVASYFGISKVKLTGGEPLLRSDVFDVISKIRSIKGITEVSMTTNGTLLAGKTKKLKKAGLSRVNVNFPSRKKSTYEAITGKDYVKNVEEGIEEACETGLNPVKVNMVVLKSLNDEEVWDMINYLANKDITLQLIELEKLGNVKEEVYSKYFFDLSEVEKKLLNNSFKVEVRNFQNRKVYYLKDGGRVELIRPFHNSEFCMNCTRIRITSDGKIKPCLMKVDNQHDILSSIRTNTPTNELYKIFLEAVMLREPFFR